MSDSKILMFPEGGYNNNNGGFGLGGWGGGLIGFILGILLGNGGLFGGNGMWGNNGLGNTAGFLSTQMNNDNGRDLIMNAINGTDSDVRLLATTLNADINEVNGAINSVRDAIQSVGAQNGMGFLQVTNAIQSGDAAISRQLCECCCENRLAIANQTNALQAQAAANHAADQLSTCQQTNALQAQADRNTAAITGAIAAQTTMITKEFCDLKEREMQEKINTQGDIITQLRGQLDNDRQTAQFAAMIAPLQAQVNTIANKQPNTVPVQWPNIQGVNVAPTVTGGFYGNFGNNWGWNNGWNGSFWG